MNNIKKEEVAVVTGAGGTLCSELAVDLAREGLSSSPYRS